MYSTTLESFFLYLYPGKESVNELSANCRSLLNLLIFPLVQAQNVRGRNPDVCVSHGLGGGYLRETDIVANTRPGHTLIRNRIFDAIIELADYW